MTRLGVAGFVLVAAGWLGGCCKQEVDARVFVGNIDEGRCRELLNGNDAPTAISCPGEEMTVCFRAGGDGVTGTRVTISPDPSSASGTFGKIGAVHFKAQADTTVTVKANPSDCATVTKTVEVISGPTPATFDAAWNDSCSKIEYLLDPLFVSPTVRARDAIANWYPVVEVSGPNGSVSTVACTTPPFLNGFHPPDNFGFPLTAPFLTTTFSNQHPATGVWEYTILAVCPQRIVCDRFARFPFGMTLTCP